MSNTAHIRILLIEDNPGDVRLLREFLKDAPRLHSETTHVERLAAAATVVSPERFDVVLLDLSLPDATGLAALRLLRGLAPSLPIVVLTGLDDEETALRAVQEGAQDFLVKGRVDTPILTRSIRYAIERKRVEEMERQLVKAHAARAEAEVGESRFRGLAEAIPQLVWEFGPGGELDYISPRWFEYTGQDPTDHKAATLLRAIHPDDLAQTLARWEEARQSATTWQSEYRLRRADGSYRWHLGRAVPWRNKEGHIAKWYGTATDIDDHKQNEHERLRLLNEAQRAIRSRDDMLATVSHDLRNPLSTIAMVASLMLAAPAVDEEGKRLHRHAAKLDRAVKRMEHLIRDLLDLASIESGHLSINPKPTQLTALISEGIDALQPAAQAKRIKLTGELRDASSVVFCDRERVLQVLTNIVGNAIKFTPEDGSILIRCTRRSQDVCLSVTDTGPGIAEADLPRVFDRFWQARSTDRAGTGLGLAICKGIVDRHQGTIWAESQVGAGTTFFFTLPLAPP